MALDDKILGFEGKDIAYPAAGAAIGIGLDYFGITDTLVTRLQDYLGPTITGYNAWAPSLDFLVSNPLLDIAGLGAFISAAGGSPKGVFLSWAAPIAYGLAKAAFDYGSAAYVGGSLGSLAAGLFLPVTAFVGAGLLAGYLFRALYKKISRSK